MPIRGFWYGWHRHPQWGTHLLDVTVALEGVCILLGPLGLAFGLPWWVREHADNLGGSE